MTCPVSFTCQCSGPGFCATFDKEQSERAFDICRGVVLTPEKCAAYREIWRGEMLPDKEPVGNALRDIVASLNLSERSGCECERWRRKMNKWGTAGCRVHQEEIIAHLNKAYHALSAADWLKSAAAAVLSGLALRINPTDPAGSLLDLAIERASQPKEPTDA